MQTLILIAEVNLGIGLLALLPLWPSNDGAEMIRPSPKSTLKVELFSIAVRSVSFVGLAAVAICGGWRVFYSMKSK